MRPGAVWAAHRAKMAAERQDALREFVAVTGAEEDRARFFLESAGWDLQVALGGGPRRPGRVLWGADTWCLKPAAGEAHSHPAGLRPDPGLRVLGLLATRASSSWARGDAGQPRPGLTWSTGPRFPLLPSSWGGETLGTVAARVETGTLGAWLPRSLGCSPGRTDQLRGTRCSFISVSSATVTRPLVPKCWEKLGCGAKLGPSHLY